MAEAGSQPPIRASDAEREATLATLSTAAGEGRLTLDELALRTERALESTTRTDLDSLTDDLPAVIGAGQPARKSRRWFVGIMGGVKQRGRWRIAPRCTVINMMGGCDLDLGQALVEGPVTEIRVFSLMGGSDIRAPDGLDVELSGFAFMGGNDVDREQTSPPAPGAPVVRVHAYSVMGGTSIKRSRSEHR